MAPHFDPSALTPDMCKDGCASLGAEFILAGITQGNVCLCGKSDSGKNIIFRTEEFKGPSIKDIRFFGPISDLPTYPYTILSFCNGYFSKAISDF